MRFTRLRRGRMGVVVVLMLLTSLLMPLTAFAAPAQYNGGNTEWEQVYTVQRGDTLAEIAGNFGVSEEELMDANSLRNPNVIYVGQQLIIPESYSKGTGGPQCDSYYTVHRGDTLSGIAQYYGIDEDQLAHVNAISDPNDIYFGQSLCIPSQGGSYGGGNEYPQQPQQYPQTDGPQRPENEEYDTPHNDSHDDGDHHDSDHQDGDHQDSQQCDPCGQSQNDDHAQNDGPQRPADDQQDGPHNDGDHQASDHQDSQQCDSCGQSQSSDHSQSDGPQRPDDDPQDGSHNDGDHQSDHQGSQQCDPCGQSQNDGPQRPDNDQQDGPHNDGDHQEGQSCDCDDSNYHDDDGHHGQQLQPTDFWKADYYNDKYFGEFFQTRQDLDVNFNWFTGSPIEGMNKDRFSVRWEKVASFKGGPTRFHATADDGVRVYVDDQLIIDHWVIQPATDFTTDLNLKPGPHKVVVEYYEEAEDAVIHVFWEPIDHHDHDGYDDHDEYN